VQAHVSAADPLPRTPDALTPLAQTGRAAASRNAYYQAIADRNTVAGRLDMSTLQGEMRREVYDRADDIQVEPAQRSWIARPRSASRRDLPARGQVSRLLMVP